MSQTNVQLDHLPASMLGEICNYLDAKSILTLDTTIKSFDSTHCLEWEQRLRADWWMCPENCFDLRVKEKEKKLLILDLKEGEKLRCKENAHCK